MNFLAHLELQEPRQVLLPSTLDLFRTIAGVDESLMCLVAVVMIAPVGASADV
jgi:hypothetical protein